MTKKIIVVLGMHRSGTSAIARGIVELGAHPGNNVLSENEANPKGYWEDADIVSLNERILKNFNMKWHSLDNPIINRFETLLPLYEKKYIEKAIEIVNNNFKLSSTLLIKDPRISITLPFWKKVFQIVGANVKYVLALRNPLETAKSLLKRNKMEIEQGIKLWSYYNFMVLKNIKNDLLVCSFSSLLNNSIQEIKRISSHIEINKFDANLEGYHRNFLENSLKHYNEDLDSLSEYFDENHVIFTMFNKLFEWSRRDTIFANEMDNFAASNLDSFMQALSYNSNNVYDYAQVFVNDGNGFSEETSKKYNLSAVENSIDIDLDELNLVNELRFDPSIYNCLLIINSIKFEKNGEFIRYQVLNGNYEHNFNNVYIFENEDPQIVIKPIDSNVTKVNINFVVFSIDVNTYSTLTKIKDQKSNQLENILHIKEQQISKMTQEIKNKEQVVEKNLEEVKRKDQIIKNKERELSEMTQEIRAKEQVVEKNLIEIKTKDQIIDNKEQELSKMVQEIRGKEQDIERNLEEIKTKDQMIENKEKELSKMVQEIRGKEQDIERNLEEMKTKDQLISNKETELKIRDQEITSLKENLNSTHSAISDFLELMNEKETLVKYKRYFSTIYKILKNTIKIIVYPRRMIKLLYNKRLLKNSKLFNEYFYLYENKDLIPHDIDLQEHFLECGWKEGRSPSPKFNMKTFLEQHPTYINENVNPVINSIKTENKIYKILKKSKFFDPHYYYSNNSDIAQVNIDPVKHYIDHGYKEGRNPSKYFNTQFYLNTYKDVNEAGINPLWHFITYGQYEGRLSIEGYVRNFGEFDQFLFKIKKLIFLKKNANISFQYVFKFIKQKGIKEFFKKIQFVLNGTEGSLKKHLTSYHYINPELNGKIKAEILNFEIKPKISVIMPVYNVEPKWLELAIKSIENQWYKNWELCIVDDCSTNEATINFLKELKKTKIKVKFLKKNLNISGASNKALDMATGEYVLLMDNDDEITVDALYEVVKEINKSGAEFIYSDEDKIELDGKFTEPHFKPDYSPDMILSQNYISHIGVIKKTLVKKVGGFTIGLEGSQDYDVYLKVLEHTDRIKHISKVLYHWRKIPGSTASEFSDKSYAQEAGRLAIENIIKRRKQKAVVLNGKYPGTYRVKYDINDNILISIIIPFKDKPELIKMCIESILFKSSYKNYEIIGVSNNSEEPESFDEMDRLSSLDSRVKFVKYNIPFNYSKINNYAVNKIAKGEHIILLNNDIEIITEDWIESMLEFSQREDVGAVGIKLFYPNNTNQHAGVIVGLGGVAGHSHKHFSQVDPGYFFRPHIIQNLSAVTAACLMVKKSYYGKVNGLDETNLKVAFNDVDFCLRIREQGYLNVYTPYAEAYHHESISRGYEDNPEKVERFQSEINYMKARHAQILAEGEPYYNENLTLDYEDFSLK